MKKNHLAYILIGLAALILIAVAVLWLYEPAPAPESPKKDAPPPGVSLMNAPISGWPDTVKLKAGETAEENITLKTRRGGPGMVHYTISSRVKDVYSTEELPWPDGLDISIEPSDFMAYPNETYISTLTATTTTDLPQGEYVFRFDFLLFEGIKGWGWITVIVDNEPAHSSPRRDAPPPGVATMNLPKLVHPTTVGLKAGEMAEENITLETKKNGPGMVHYAIPSRVKAVYSKEELPWPDGLNFSIEPSDFMAYPNETYTSNLTISTTPNLLQGEYVFRFYSLFEGVMEGGGWLKVIVD